MQTTQASLGERIGALAEHYRGLSASLTGIAQTLSDTRLPTASDWDAVVSDMASCRADGTAVYAAVREALGGADGEAGTEGLPPTATPESAGIDALQAALREADERERDTWRRAVVAATAVARRVDGLSYTGPTATIGDAVHAEARSALAAIEGDSPDPEAIALAQAIVDGQHPLAALLRVVDGRDGLDEGTMRSLHAEIDAAFVDGTCYAAMMGRLRDKTSDEIQAQARGAGADTLSPGAAGAADRDSLIAPGGPGAVDGETTVVVGIGEARSKGQTDAAASPNGAGGAGDKSDETPAGAAGASAMASTVEPTATPASPAGDNPVAAGADAPRDGDTPVLAPVAALAASPGGAIGNTFAPDGAPTTSAPVNARKTTQASLPPPTTGVGITAGGAAAAPAAAGGRPAASPAPTALAASPSPAPSRSGGRTASVVAPPAPPAGATPTDRTSDSAPRAADLLLWELLADGLPGLAYYLADSDPVLPDWAVEAATIAPHVSRADGPIAARLAEDFARAAMIPIEAKELRLLCVAMALRPALVAPRSGPAILLRRAEFDSTYPHLRELCASAAAYADRGQPFDALVLTSITRGTARAKDVALVLGEARSWRNSATARTNLYHRAGQVWRMWIESGGLFAALIETICTDPAEVGHDASAAVAEIVERLSRKPEFAAAVKATDREILRGERRDEITGDALKQLHARTDEVLLLARRWLACGSRDRASDDPDDAHREAIARTARDAILPLCDPALHELGAAMAALGEVSSGTPRQAMAIALRGARGRPRRGGPGYGRCTRGPRHRARP